MSREEPNMKKNKVLDSFSLRGEERCVDIFVRPDGTFGFEEYRRDVDDQGGWFAVGFFSSQVFASREQTLTEARARVLWLNQQLRD